MRTSLRGWVASEEAAPTSLHAKLAQFLFLHVISGKGYNSNHHL